MKISSHKSFQSRLVQAGAFIGLCCAFVVPSSLSGVTITSFGNTDSPTYTVINNDFTDTQSASSIGIVGNDADTLVGDLGSTVDAATDFAANLDIEILGSTADPANPGSGGSANTPSTTFTIRLFDSSFDSADYTGGSWIDLRDNNSSLLSKGSFDSGFDPSDIIGLDLVTNGLGGSSIDATLTNASFVPEPSVYSVVVGMLSLGYVVTRRRRRD